MMRLTRQSPSWWKAWVALLLLGGLLVLEPQAPLSLRGHQVALLAITLLMYGIMMGWLRCSRGALIQEAYEHEQAQEWSRKAKQQQRALTMSDYESWEDV